MRIHSIQIQIHHFHLSDFHSALNEQQQQNNRKTRTNCSLIERHGDFLYGHWLLACVYFGTQLNGCCFVGSISDGHTYFVMIAKPHIAATIEKRTNGLNADSRSVIRVVADTTCGMGGQQMKNKIHTIAPAAAAVAIVWMMKIISCNTNHLRIKSITTTFNLLHTNELSKQFAPHAVPFFPQHSHSNWMRSIYSMENRLLIFFQFVNGKCIESNCEKKRIQLTF